MIHLNNRKIKIPSIFLLWCGQGISSLFSALYSFALSWYVIELTDSSLQMGMILFISMIPKIFFSLYSGVIGDRVNKKYYLILLNFIRFAVTILWSLSLIHRQITIIEIYTLTLFLSSIDAFFNPVYSALIPELLKEKNLSRAASFNQMINRISMILAPSLAGILIIYFQLNEFIAINSIGFLIAAIFTFFITSINSKLNTQKNNIIEDFKTGLHYFIKTKYLFWSVILITIANIGVVSYNVNLANYINHSLKLSSNVYGITLTSFSLGSFVSLTILTAVNLNKSRGKLYIWSLLAGGLLFFLIPYVHSPTGLYTVFFLIGFLFSITSTISTTILFSVEEEEYRARILGIASISSLLSPIGMIIWGAIGDVLSPGWAMGISGFIIIATSISGMLTQLYRYS
ncbi:MFS transporter [Macrococcus equi]|uniref:MFS transporter n=1 Tax=Macrococcus equi TaxID=3395462 RepID=UPI0039BEB55E